jgi:predicted phage-related endonuclease
MIKYYYDLEQGSDAWLEARRALLTASEMKLIITPTLKIADNDKSRAHHYELLSQKISGYTEPSYINEDMLRGISDEVEVKILYSINFEPVKECGFITNDKWGFKLGYSADGLIGEDGLIEVKSRRQKYQVETILSDNVPDDYMIQIQTGLLVSERKWLDFLSYSGGLPMFKFRVLPDEKIQNAIIEASRRFYEKLAIMEMDYRIKADKFLPTVRRIEQEMTI